MPYWYRITLPLGVDGYVRKRWVHVAPDPTVATPGLPFEPHVVDVGVGDGFLLDIGEHEILVDGGMYGAPFIDYFSDQELIQSSIDLAVVTHADADHWKGMKALLGLPTATPKYSVLEFSEPDYDRGCRSLDSYDTLVRSMKQIVPAAGFKRSLETVHVPSASSAVVTLIDLPSIPRYSRDIAAFRAGTGRP